MFKTGEEVIDWIHSQAKFGGEPGLSRMNAALGMLNEPHKELNVIHIAGTNGKGSTVTYLRSVLQRAGYTVGTFTSPYIEMFHERICVNDVPIRDEELVICANVVKPVVQRVFEGGFGQMTEFEIITLMSFVFFQFIDVNVVIYEVGIGGRLDSTNVITPIVCGITNIGLDHQAILGNSLEEIASEKLGIVKPHVALFTTIEQSHLIELAKKKCDKEQSELFEVLQVHDVSEVTYTPNGMSFVLNEQLKLKLRMHGQHQVKNATLAYAMLQYLNEKKEFKIDTVHITEGFEKAFWKGRFEIISDDSPLIILDGAHNKEGVEKLCETLTQKFPSKNLHFIMSVLRDKHVHELIEPLRDIATTLHLSTFDFYRAMTIADLEKLFAEKRIDYVKSYEDLIRTFKQSLNENDCIVITGSLYFVAEVRKYLLS